MILPRAGQFPQGQRPGFYKARDGAPEAAPFKQPFMKPAVVSCEKHILSQQSVTAADEGRIRNGYHVRFGRACIGGKRDTSPGWSCSRCTGDAEAMAVRYGRDGRCGRIPLQAQVAPKAGGARAWQDGLVSGPDRMDNTALSLGRHAEESDWQYRRYNTFAGCEAVRRAI